MRRRTNGEAEARDSRRRNCRGVDMVMGGWELNLVFNFIMVQEGHRGTRRFTYRAILCRVLMFTHGSSFLHYIDLALE